ncbi:MAG: hypothetical protein AB1831_13270 [Pseudomonadota bacterium]
MTSSSQIEAMPAGLRQAFLAELPARCNDIEALILRLETTPGDHETLNDQD